MYFSTMHADHGELIKYTAELEEKKRFLSHELKYVTSNFTCEQLKAANKKIKSKKAKIAALRKELDAIKNNMVVIIKTTGNCMVSMTHKAQA
jgi:phosphopantetheine adenylyltransferase